MNVEKQKKFMEVAKTYAQLSKDNRTKVGALILGPNEEVRASGWNGFPRGINDFMEERQEAPEKYFWFEHAERNAIYNAARVGTALEGCIIFTLLFPCADCSRAIIQSGIKEVVTYEPDWENPRWKESFLRSKQLFKEAKIKITYI